MDEGKKAEILQMFKSAAKPIPKRSRSRMQNGAIHISGNSNIVGTNTIIIRTSAAASHKTEALTPAQRAAIDKLIEETMFHESLATGRPISERAVWMRTKKSLDLGPGVVGIKECSRVESYLRGWISKAITRTKEKSEGKSSMQAVMQATADVKWANRRISSILRTVKELQVDAKLDRVLADRYGATMLKELTNDQLQDVFKLVSTWR